MSLPLSENKKALFDYQVSEIFEAGMILSGPEVKSIKAGTVSLKGAFLKISPDGRVLLINSYVAPYPPARLQQRDYNPNADRQLLLRRREIDYLIGKSRQSGLALVPLKIWQKNGFLKITIALGRGRKKYDKRELIKKREFARKKRQLLG